MQNAAAMLYCANPTCQALNPEDSKFCQKCRTPLVRQYLWGGGNGVELLQLGELLGDRYCYKGERVFLDTKPGLLSANSLELSASYLPYLRLSPVRLHVPQVYEWFPSSTSDGASDGASDGELVLFDHVPFWLPQAEPNGEAVVEAMSNGMAAQQVQLFPAILTVWAEAHPLRQLNWLWQMANLWQPLSSEQVVSSLLNPDLLRVEGGILRLLELSPDSISVPLSALGELWLQWSVTARPEIADWLQQMSQQLIQGQIHNAELLVEQVDEAIAQVAQAQSRTVQIATLSDQGPIRQRNEDACSPESGTVATLQTEGMAATVIVCDGIGGHQGGDVASHLAIAAVEQRLQILKPEVLDAVTLTVELEKAVCLANDQISQRNDSEQRYDRQRMGTTLVMGLLRDHELFVTHIGDSRVYWITRWGCHQITLDDDVASREVRLGYSTYRQALQQPSSGSLVQALGMGDSNQLYPTVQRFLLDEDSVFLFCSDGLSDNDRVDTCWDTEILPLLSGKTDLATVAQRLVEVANTLNGYDNTTVGLLYCQVVNSSPVSKLSSSSLEMRSSNAATAIAVPLATTSNPKTPKSAVDSTDSLNSTAIGTQLLKQKSSSVNPLPLLLGIVVLASLGLGLLAALLPLGQRARSPIAPSASPTALSSAIPNDINAPPNLTVGSRIQLQRINPEGKLPMLFSDPQSLPSATPQVLGMLPIGSTLEVLSMGETTLQDRWVQLRVCSTPAGTSPESPSAPPAVRSQTNSPEISPKMQASPSAINPSVSVESPGAVAATLLRPGQAGWIREASILPWIGVSQSSPEQKGVCANSVTLNSVTFKREAEAIAN